MCQIGFVCHSKILHGKVVGKEKKEIMIITTCEQDVFVESLWKMIRRCWDIKDCIFSPMKTHWNMGNCFIRDEKAIPIICWASLIIYGIYFYSDAYEHITRKYTQAYVVG